MTAPFDVLAVMDRAAINAESHQERDEMLAARAAVAELVEKARAVSVLVDACACWNCHNNELIDALANFGGAA